MVDRVGDKIECSSRCQSGYARPAGVALTSIRLVVTRIGAPFE